MNVYFPEKKLAAVHDKLRWIQGPGSKALADDVADAMVAGNKYDRLNKRTSEGRTVAALKRPRAGEYKSKTGPPLAPSYGNSRVIRSFRAKPRRNGSRGYLIAAGWENVVSKRGFPFLPAHEEGRPPLPERKIFGISPRTRGEINKLVSDFKQRARKVGRLG